MSDAITLVTYSGSQVTPQHDALMQNLGLMNNGIIYGCEVTIQDSSTLHINAGVGVIYGREFEIVDSEISVSLSSSGTLLGQLYVHMDLADTSEPISLVVETASTLTDLTDDPDVNTDTGVSEMQLATFNAGTATISDLVQTFDTISLTRDVIGSEDISSLGDGSVTGAISQINSDLTDLNTSLSVSSVTVTSSITTSSNVVRIGNLVVGSIYWSGEIVGTSDVIATLSVPPISTVWTGGNLIMTSSTNYAIPASYAINTNGEISQGVTGGGTCYRGALSFAYECAD